MSGHEARVTRFEALLQAVSQRITAERALKLLEEERLEAEMAELEFQLERLREQQQAAEGKLPAARELEEKLHEECIKEELTLAAVEPEVTVVLTERADKDTEFEGLLAEIKALSTKEQAFITDSKQCDDDYANAVRDIRSFQSKIVKAEEDLWRRKQSQVHKRIGIEGFCRHQDCQWVITLITSLIIIRITLAFITSMNITHIILTLMIYIYLYNPDRRIWQFFHQMI